MNRRQKKFISLMGEVEIARPYYHCSACGHGCFPWDAELRFDLRKLSRAAQEVTSIAGIQTPFGQCSETTLRKMCGLRLSESTVQRVTEDAGDRLAQQCQQKQEPRYETAWKWRKDAAGRTCAYVSLDATGVRQQAHGGGPHEGRMAYVASIFNPRSPHDPAKGQRHQSRYLAGHYDLKQLGLELRRQAAQVGWDDAEQQVALSDGGSGMEEFLRVNFPLAVRIIDFWHVADHLVELSKRLFAGQSEAEREQWTDDICHRLKHEGGAAVLARLEEIRPTKAEARRVLRETMQYFRNHQHKMDYPRYLAQGWQIGSGAIESACKTVVGGRLKGGGMRWREYGSNAVCHLRAVYLSSDPLWEILWNPRTQPASAA